MKRLLPVLLASAFISFLAADRAPEHVKAASTPTVTATLEGARTAVFVTPQDSCEPDDIPDAMARAFRDYTGTIHFATASSDLFQSLGPTLDSLQHSCVAGFRSANDPNPAHFNDQAWLDSFFTLDGHRVAALSHTEYHGWSHPGECKTQNIGACEYDSDTFHASDDGGYHFSSFKVPNNLVAEIPYQYRIDEGPMGYSVDTNVIQYGGWYYAVATSWTWPSACSGNQPPHRCITSGGAPLRTADVFDPSSWRGWNGSDFSVAFDDPYLGPISDREAHVYTPVPYMFCVNAINIYQPANIVVATLWDYWDNELGQPGLYLTTSTDLVHWTTPQLVATLAQITADDPPGSWLYAYFSLLDPAAPDMNFSVIGDTPYLYFVRLNNNNVYDRVVYRQKIKLSVNP